MDEGGTITWMESIESSREQRPRAMQEQLPRSGYRYIYRHLVVKGNLIFDTPFNDLGSVKDIVF